MGRAEYLGAKISDKAIRPPEKFKKGVPLKKHPEYIDSDMLCIDEWHFECGKCGSKSTLCVYFSGMVDISGKYHEYELVCKKCGWHTLHSYGD